MLLEKSAVIYGGGGSIAGALARAFAREGATVFLVGPAGESLEEVAEDIAAAGGQAEVAELDALGNRAVDDHVQAVVSQAGSIDRSLYLIWPRNAQGILLVGTTAADSARLVTTGVTANLITARAGARHMIEQGAGVISASDGGSACGSPIMGSTDPADAVTDTSIRNPAAEVGPHGVHVLSIWTVRLPEALSPGRLAEVDCKHQDEAAFEGLTENLDRIRMTRRSPRLAEVAATATFLALSKAGAITGAFVNVTSGAFPNYMAPASRTTERQGEAA